MNNIDKTKIIDKLCSAKIKSKPFNHCVINNFLPKKLALDLSSDFLSYNDDSWFVYKNKIEDKKLLTDWRKFPQQTYQMFSFLNSNLVLSTLSNIFSCTLLPDNGLHGGGWHIHASGGKLNPHLDYSIHPNLKLQRKLNLIIYLCEEWLEEYGGHFGLWNCDKFTKKASNLHTEIPVGFNKAVIFDTTQNSWHGLSREVACPSGLYRKSLAVYYLCEPSPFAEERNRALFSPTENQKNDKEIEDLIARRSDLKLSKTAYVTE